MPKRIQRKRTKGWKMPENTVYVGRPTLFGNPFIHQDNQKSVDAFRQLCLGGAVFEMGSDKLRFAKNANKHSLHWAWNQWIRENIHHLRGKDLACWCKEGEPCHADVLLEMANSDEK